VLTQAIRWHQQKQANKPFLFIVHGNEYEAHRQLIDVMVEKDLPVALNCNQQSIQVRPLIWPSGHKSQEDFKRKIWANLGYALYGDYGRSEKNIQEHINTLPAPVLISIEIIEKYDFNPSISEDLSLFLEFFLTNLSLNSEIKLLIALLIKYQSVAKVPNKLEPLRFLSLKRIFNKGQINDCKTPAKCLREIVSAGLFNNQIVTLEELPSISHKDVLDWINHCGFVFREKDIEAIFNGKSHIPMDDLVDSLQQLITI